MSVFEATGGLDSVLAVWGEQFARGWRWGADTSVFGCVGDCFVVTVGLGTDFVANFLYLSSLL